MSKADNLYKYFQNNKDGKLLHKWLHYFDIYETYFQAYANKPLTLVEFGVSHGGSLEMWRDYFGKKARIIGIDINPECKKFKTKNTEIYIGDQEDIRFLEELKKTIGEADIIIDDGGHTVSQQLATFNAMYSIVKTPGVYLVEDLHTNYWREFGGGLRKQGTFIEKAKELTDQLNAWHSRDNESLSVDNFTESTDSMHFYDSVVVFKKANRQKPSHKQIGKPTLSSNDKWDYMSADNEDLHNV